MDEKIKEIQERWHRLPIPTYNQSARDIGYLLLYITKLQDHAEKLKEGIKDFLDCCHREDHNIPERVMDKLRKLIEKK
jgi:hypothetical protein